MKEPHAAELYYPNIPRDTETHIAAPSQLFQLQPLLRCATDIHHIVYMLQKWYNKVSGIVKLEGESGQTKYIILYIVVHIQFPSPKSKSYLYSATAMNQHLNPRLTPN